MYFVLNACRILAFAQAGLILSKDEGGQWGLAHLPTELHPVIKHALALYRGEEIGSQFSSAELQAFATYASHSVKLA